MENDRERLRELVTDPELHELPEDAEDDSADQAERKDSDQAQDNLERMLETGEENPIS